MSNRSKVINNSKMSIKYIWITIQAPNRQFQSILFKGTMAALFVQTATEGMTIVNSISLSEKEHKELMIEQSRLIEQQQTTRDNEILAMSHQIQEERAKKDDNNEGLTKGPNGKPIQIVDPKGKVAKGDPVKAEDPADDPTGR